MIARRADLGLYERGAATLVASWAAYADGTDGAEVIAAPGVAIAVFRDGPERDVYNNALLERGLGAAARRQALDAVEAAYAAAGVPRYAVWVHESDAPMLAGIETRSYAFDTSTRAMGMDLADLRVPRPRVPMPPARWSDHVAHLSLTGLPDGFLAGMDPDAFHVLAVDGDGGPVATGLAFDLAGDCGIYNISTLPHARRRGLGTAITAELAYAARDRGCTTASLQSTPMAESTYARIGFRDLGRLLEFVPAVCQRSSTMSSRGREQQISALPSAGGSTGSGL